MLQISINYGIRSNLVRPENLITSITERVTKMTLNEFKEELCKRISDYYNGDFPCFCGDNKLSNLNADMNDEDEAKAKEILSLFK